MDDKKRVPNTMLLSIGFSAGMIAVFFPRLMPYFLEMTEDEQGVHLQFVQFPFIVGALLIAAMMGVAMIWLYMGTREHTKNLFMSALALPAVISGGLNMSNMATVADEQLNLLSSQIQVLEDELIQSEGIEQKSVNNRLQQSSGPTFFPFVSVAHADDVMTLSESRAGPGISIRTESLSKRYLVFLDASPDQEAIQNRMREIQDSITDVEVISANGEFILVQSQPRTKSEALLEAIRIRKRFGWDAGVVKLE